MAGQNLETLLDIYALNDDFNAALKAMNNLLMLNKPHLRRDIQSVVLILRFRSNRLLKP